MIKLKPLSVGFVSTVMAGIIAYPLGAQAQFSPVQNAEQSVVIRGNNNTVNQEINQTVIFRPGRGSGVLRDSPFSRSKGRKRKFKKAKRRYKQWKKGYEQKYKGWKRGWSHRDDDDDDDYEYDDD